MAASSNLHKNKYVEKALNEISNDESFLKEKDLVSIQKDTLDRINTIFRLSGIPLNGSYTYFINHVQNKFADGKVSYALSKEGQIVKFDYIMFYKK